MARVGIIGGSGLDDPELLKDAADESLATPWGEPSSPLRRGTIVAPALVLWGAEDDILPETQAHAGSTARTRCTGLILPSLLACPQ